MSSPHFGTTIIDDRSATVAYTGTWVVGGTTNEWNDTVSSSVKAGDKITVLFIGKTIGVYGTYDSTSGGVKTSYAIDGGPATTVTASPSSNGLDEYQQLFWKSGTLSKGSHSLVITMVAVNSSTGYGEGTIWFDYFNATFGTESSYLSSPRSSYTTSSYGTAPSTTSTVAVIAKKVLHSAIIGATVGAVCIVLVLCALFLHRRKRRENARTAQQMHQLPSAIEPHVPNHSFVGGFTGFPQPLASPY
ncbi:hypothetical protein B0H10DRAFT_2195223, partial [Mycena sp. CBHHK59/15]